MPIVIRPEQVTCHNCGAQLQLSEDERKSTEIIRCPQCNTELSFSTKPTETNLPESTFKMTPYVFVFFIVPAVFICLVFPPAIAFAVALVFMILIALQAIEYFGTELTVKNDRVTYHRGMLSHTIQDVPYTRINSVIVNQGLLGKLLNYGDVGIVTGNDSYAIWARMITDPEAIRELVQGRIKK